MISLGNLLHRQLGDDGGAQAMYRQAIESGDADSRAFALVSLADLLKRRRGMTDAKAAWRQVIGSRQNPWAKVAFSRLVHQLEAEGDVAGLRAAHRAGVKTGNSEAPYALVAIGNLLRERDDTEGWRAAWQQAIDTGYDHADDLREALFPPAEDGNWRRPPGAPGLSRDVRPSRPRPRRSRPRPAAS
jgi:hypothetical protein